MLEFGVTAAGMEMLVVVVDEVEEKEEQERRVGNGERGFVTI